MHTKKEQGKKVNKTSKPEGQISHEIKAPVYSTTGKKSGEVALPESVFGLPWNAALMHQVVTSMQANARIPVAHTKFRGEVSGGGKKPWRQKGTGRARHGSIRSPIWRGGGVTHGPRKEKNYYRAIPKKMRVKALYTALSGKWKDNQILFVDAFDMPKPKTAQAKATLNALSKVSGFEKLSHKRKNAALIALAASNESIQKSFRNMGNVTCVEARNLNPLSILQHTYLIIENPNMSLPAIAGRAKK